MNRHDAGRSVRPWVSWLAVGTVSLVLVGCGTPGLFKRAVSAEEQEQQHYDTPIVGDRTTVGNAEPVRLGGVGLVTGLDGTGGDCAHDTYRAMLADDLRKAGERAPERLLKSPDCAMVIVEALLHPGAGKGELIDIEVKLPPNSRATSLRGGVLRRCRLFNYEFAKNLRPDYTGDKGMLKGYPLASAEGPVLITGGEATDASRSTHGRIWQGGKVLKDYPLALVMNRDSQRVAVTGLITDRVNALFQTGLPSAEENKAASASSPHVVALHVPATYRSNVPRFLRVVRCVPLVEGSERSAGKDSRTYRQKLHDDLLDPTRTVVAALRLEALGQKSVPILREGLTSQHPLVRFTSAEALAYLGSPACAEELGKAARHPLFRAYALTALASLNESACQAQLRGLIEANLDDETRYGAFRALRTLNPRSPAVAGEMLGGSFWLHRIAPGSSPLVHATTTRRAEVVLMGDAPRLRPPFSILAGEFTITADANDVACAVSRVPLNGERVLRTCPLEVEAVIRCLTDLGGQYGDVVAMLQQAGNVEAVSCRVRFDALPRAASIADLAAAGAADDLPAGQDLGLTPTLYGTTEK